MPYTINDGTQINYQVEGEGPCLVLLHGFADSLESWYEAGYVDALKPSYRLILLDARGHGKSAKPHDQNAYENRLLVSDVIAVLDELNIAKAHFWGYSMGGRTGFALSKYSSDRCTSLIIGGAHPFPLSKEQFDTRITELQNGGLESLVDHHLGATAPSAWKARLMANDFDALVASWKGRLSGPGFEDVLPDMMMPCLIYAGEADTAYPGIKKCTESMPHVTFLSLPGLNHAGAFAESTRVLPQITSFVRSIPR